MSRPQNREYEIVHSYTGEVICEVSASCATDALAMYSLAEGFADPREVAEFERDAQREANGSVWADPYVLRPDGLLGMVVTNYEVHAQGVGLAELAWAMADRAQLGHPPVGPLTLQQAGELDAYDAYHAEMEAEYEAEQAAGGRTVCPQCGERKVRHRSVVTLGYEGHPGAEYSDLAECENCNWKEL